MIKEAIAKLAENKGLSSEETGEVFEEIFAGKAAPSQIAAFLVSLKMKGEEEQEIAAAAQLIRRFAKKIDVRDRFAGVPVDSDCVIDTCGTGGSGVNKFNISTAAAFVVSAGGFKVAKHGNRAISSTCGSADVLEELGIKAGLPFKVCEEAIKRVGIGFLYAPLYHPALGAVSKIRREVGVRTIFNILGPLCNPAGATHQLLGVYKKDLVPPISRVLKRLGLKRAFVVHSRDLKDEVSLGGLTFVSFLDQRKIKNFTLRPSDFGLKKVRPDQLAVNSVKESAKAIRKIFDGEAGAKRDTVLASASCCFYLAGKAKSFKEGVKMAAGLIDCGGVKKKFLELKDFLASRDKGGLQAA